MATKGSKPKLVKLGSKHMRTIWEPTPEPSPDDNFADMRVRGQCCTVLVDDGRVWRVEVGIIPRRDWTEQSYVVIKPKGAEPWSRGVELEAGPFPTVFGARETALRLVRAL